MKRDRHGILRERLPDDVELGIAELPAGVTEHDAAMARMGVERLGYIARSVFKGRNAQFVRDDADVRAALRPVMRRHLRRLLWFGKRMRAALLQGDWRAARDNYRDAYIELLNADAEIRDAEHPVLMVGRGRRVQLREFQARAAKARTIYTEADKDRWRAAWAAEYPQHSKARAASLIAQREGRPEAARTIRRAL